MSLVPTTEEIPDGLMQCRRCGGTAAGQEQQPGDCSRSRHAVLLGLQAKLTVPPPGCVCMSTLFPRPSCTSATFAPSPPFRCRVPPLVLQHPFLPRVLLFAQHPFVQIRFAYLATDPFNRIRPNFFETPSFAFLTFYSIT